MISTHTTYSFPLELSKLYKRHRPELVMITAILRERGHNWDVYGSILTVIDLDDEDEALALVDELNDLLTESRVIHALEQ